MRKKLLLLTVAAILLPIGLSYAEVKTNLHSTKVNEGLKGQLNGNGEFDTLKFADGTSQTTAGGSGDSVSVDSVAVTDPDLVSTGDIDVVNTANTVTFNINADKIVNADVNTAAAIAGSKIQAASLTNSGVLELLTTAEINTGTDTTRAIPIDQYVASNRNVRYLALRVIEATTDVAVATTKGGDFEMRFAGTITGIGAYNDTAGTTGTMTIDVNLNGTTVMTTNKITIDTAEKSSLTAATAPALTTTTVAAGGLITIDIDAIHTTAAKGLTVWLSIRMD